MGRAPTLPGWQEGIGLNLPHTLWRICLISRKAGLDPGLRLCLHTQRLLHWSGSISLCMINWSNLHFPDCLSVSSELPGPTLSSFKSFTQKLQAPLGLSGKMRINQLSLGASHTSVSWCSVILGAHHGVGFLASQYQVRTGAGHLIQVQKGT